MAMKHNCRWDAQHGCIRFELSGELLPHEADQLIDQLLTIERQHESKGLIIDHTRSPKPLSRDTRALLERRGNETSVVKFAFFGMNNLNRMIAQMAISLLGRSNTTQFFQSEAEAEAWIAQSS